MLGTLSVLRSNALSTGQTALRGVLGTVVGIVVGGVVVTLVGTNQAVLWVLLPISILVAGLAPAAISFAAGQAAFTLTLTIFFNIIQPVGYRIGLVRIEDIAIGCAVSLVFGVLFWPRGAASALGRALAEAYETTGAYLARAVRYGVHRCERGLPSLPRPALESTQAAAASRRLDDAFREYLAERGRKQSDLATVTALVTGVVAPRLAADAVARALGARGRRARGRPFRGRGRARARRRRGGPLVHQPRRGPGRLDGPAAPGRDATRPPTPGSSRPSGATSPATPACPARRPCG